VSRNAVQVIGSLLHRQENAFSLSPDRAGCLIAQIKKWLADALSPRRLGA
jgi:hypothetical protein